MPSTRCCRTYPSAGSAARRRLQAPCSGFAVRRQVSWSVTHSRWTAGTPYAEVHIRSPDVGMRVMHRPHVQEAEIEIDPAQLENFKIAITAQIEAAIRVEPGIVALYAVCEVDNPVRVRVFEIYRDSDA